MAPVPARGMGAGRGTAAWEKVDPDSHFDPLPQPYRLINKVIEDILGAVGEKIDVIVGQRRSEEYEFELPESLATSIRPIHGRITCAFVENRCSNRLSLGTSLGDVLVIDSRTREAVIEKRIFDGGESVHCIAVTMEGVYQQSYTASSAVESKEPQMTGRPSTKLMVTGTMTPNILVYSFVREQYGIQLKPFCAIGLPEVLPQSSASAEGSEQGAGPHAPPPPVQQLYARGTYGAVWVLALLSNRSINAFLCPLGAPESLRTTSPDKASLGAVSEEQEAEEQDDDLPIVLKEFKGAFKVETARYRFSLPGMSPRPGLVPDPPLHSIMLTVFSLRPESAMRSAVACQVPLFCMVASLDSNLVYAFSIRANGPLVAPESIDTDALLKELAPPIGHLKEPLPEPTVAEPLRCWMFPAKTSAVAVTTTGGIFAVGGALGALAVVNIAGGPCLQAMLPGHYGAVAALSFHKSNVLLSVGADSWIHHYCMRSNTLLSRCLFSSPPSPPPATDVAASPVTPLGLALDAGGNLRLLDLKRGRKIARVLCRENDNQGLSAQSSATALEGREGGVAANLSKTEDPLPKRILATATAFCALCEAAPRPPIPGEGNGQDAEVAVMQDDRSCVVFFDQAATICGLFPAVKKGSGCGVSAFELFDTLTPEDLQENPGHLLPLAAISEPAGTRKFSKLSTLSSRKSAVASGGMEPVTMPIPHGAPSSLGVSLLSPAQVSFSSAKKAAKAPSVMRLTAKNLMRHGDPASPNASCRASLHSEGGHSGGGANGATQDRSGVEAGVIGIVPENWHVSVRRYLRSTMEGKEARQANMKRHIEVMRREVEGS